MNRFRILLALVCLTGCCLGYAGMLETELTAKRSIIPYAPPPPQSNPYHPLGDFQQISPLTRNIALGDFNGDGKMDIVIAPTYATWQPQLPIQIWLNQGDGTFVDGTNEIIELRP
jgi:hypothetical protein